MRIALLFQESPLFEDDNYLRFGRVLSDAHDVTLVDVDSLQLLNNAICGVGFEWSSRFQVNEQLPGGEILKLDHDLIWVLSIGDRATFLDKFQLLYALSRQTRVINSLNALMHLKSKYYLATNPELFPQPETHASRDASELEKLIRKKGGKWIVKPPAGSLGRDVFLVEPGDTNLDSILQHLCGFENKNYTMVQRWVPEIEAGEKRVLIAGGQVIDHYHRHASTDHRTNVTQGAQISHCDLTPHERAYCEKLAAHLLSQGVSFSGIDLAWPWLIEVNVINPGGVATMEELTGVDRSEDVVQSVLKSL